MKNYAVLTIDNKVGNIIVAPSLDIAEEVTSSRCIYVTDETGVPHFGLSYADGVFEQPSLEETPE